MNKLEKIRICQILVICILCIVLGCTFRNVNLLQGSARVVNYAGITRGATQRLIKLEITNQASPELQANLEVILSELQNGGKINRLRNYKDKNFNKCIAAQIKGWNDLKKEIQITRNSGYKNSRIIEVSEAYYTLADNTVSAAERFADILAFRIALLEAGSIITLIVLSFIYLWDTITVRNISAEKLRKVQILAENDALTDLLNRRSFNENLCFYEKSSKAYTLILIDVDSFKNFNDKYGHTMGDMVLKRVADNMKLSFRSSDKLFRIGGDEFAIIMEDVENTMSSIVKDKIKILMKSLSEIKDNIPSITLSIGISFSQNLKKGERIFEAADEALYSVKENGKNGYKFYKNQK